MRKTVFTIAALSLASLASGGAAWADEEQRGAFQGTLTVQYTGSLSCASGDSACSKCLRNNGLFVDAVGIAQTTLGPLFAKLLKCATPPGTTEYGKTLYGGYAGTLTLSTTPPVIPPSASPNVPAPPKDVLTLTYAGQNDDGTDFYGVGPFDGTLTIESGTGKFRGAQGTLIFLAQSPSGVTASEFGVTTSPFEVTGNAFYLFEGTIQGISQ